jgi:hypothetical protein
MSSAALAQKTTVVRLVVVKTDYPAACPGPGRRQGNHEESGLQRFDQARVPSQQRRLDAGAVIAAIEYPGIKNYVAGSKASPQSAERSFG